MQRITQGRQLRVTLLASTGWNIRGLIQHFLRQQLGACQLDQLERAANLLQILHRLLQQAAVHAFSNELLKAGLSLLHDRE